ncbi:MAG: S1 RNA-binding domain-containing protein [Anaerolineales bacterium]|jgi:small subunit ribosomal protein S1
METETLATKDESVEIKDLSDIKRKMHFTGKVVKTTLAGAVVDIGLETPGVVHISQLQSKPVNRVEDVVEPGQTVDVWVRRVFPKKKRIELTMIEPLPLEWREIKRGMVVKGKVTRLEKFGAFVDIGAERPGLVHISEMAHDYIKSPSEVVKEGDEIEVQVLNVNQRKKQIKLSMKALEEKPAKLAKQIQQEESGEPLHNEPVPTAMEVALREAMERSHEEEEETPAAKGKRKSTSKNQEIEDILSRTLENKVRSNK